MTSYDIVTIFAVLAGPILAVHAQKRVEIHREKRNRRLRIFATLMATRATNLSAAHVEALNSIDIEYFNDKRAKRILAAWRNYLDHLNQTVASDTWEERRQDLFSDLLFEMGLLLGYEFDKVQIKRGIYAPRGHFDAEQEWNAIRRSLAKLLEGNAGIPVTLLLPEELAKRQAELQSMIISHYEGRIAIPVKLVTSTADRATEAKK